MSGFHAWAEALHRESMQPIKSRPSRYQCSNCQHRATRNQAKNNKGICTHCKQPLRAYEQFAHRHDLRP